MKSAKISYPIPVGYLEHEATHSRLNVYRNINVFQRFMIRICFGLEFHKY